jgi:hypothetical protein
VQFYFSVHLMSIATFNRAVVAERSKRTMFTQVLDRSIEGLTPVRDRKVVVSLSAYDDQKVGKSS